MNVYHYGSDLKHPTILNASIYTQPSNMQPSTNFNNPYVSQFVQSNSYYNSSVSYNNFPYSTYQHSVPLFTKQQHDSIVSSIEYCLSNQIENLHVCFHNQLILTPFNYESLNKIQSHFYFQMAGLNCYRNNLDYPISPPRYSHEQAGIKTNMRFMNDEYYFKCQLLISESFIQLSKLPNTQQVNSITPIIGTQNQISSSGITKLPSMPMYTSIPKTLRKTYPEYSKISSLATSLMSNWYLSHEEHPYPDHDTCTMLAKDGHVQVEQVKRWFSNKRMRSSNTKSLHDIANRRSGRKPNSNNTEMKKM